MKPNQEMLPVLFIDCCMLPVDRFLYNMFYCLFNLYV